VRAPAELALAAEEEAAATGATEGAAGDDTAASGEGDGSTVASAPQATVKNESVRAAISFLIWFSILNAACFGLLRIRPSEHPQPLPLTLG